MPGAQRLSSASAQLWRSSSGLNAAQWRNASRQWQRQYSLRSTRPRIASRFPHLSTSTPFRQQSTTASTAASAGSRLVAYVYGTGLLVVLGFGYLYITDTRASIHQWLVVPTLRLVHHDPEEAHHAGIRYIKGLYDFNLHPRERGNQDQALGDLKIEVFGHVLDNPLGTSAGIDKNAEIPSALMALGPAIVEVGGATPLPQAGNDKPRVFRIPSQNALINRYGLNSEGAEHVAMQLRERVRQYAFDNGLGLDAESERAVLDGEAGIPPGSLVPGKLLAVQIAKNKTTPDNDLEAVASDYVYCVERLAKYADILVVNVSSPNTPGLRDLQAAKPLTAILTAVVGAAKSCDRKSKPAVMVKVSPDEDSDAQIDGICTAVWASGVDGVIVGNTTKKRPDPIPQGYIMPAKEAKLLTEVGGYSGPQMFERTLNLVKRYRVKLDQGPEEDDASDSANSSPAASQSNTPASGSIDASVQRDAQRLKPQTSEAEEQSKQPLVQLPDRHSSSDESSSSSPPPPPPSSSSLSSSSSSKSSSPSSSSPSTPSSSSPAPAASTSASTGSSQAPPEAKVIFATGGITNGEQCLEILNAGASVCQVYTAMMYGGVGTITRMKAEMRKTIKEAKQKQQ